MNIPENMTLQGTIEQDGNRGAKDGSQTWSDRFAWLARVLVLIALVVAPWMLGCVDFWAQFLISLWLLLALALWWFDTALNKRNFQAMPYVSVLLFVGVLIGLFQMMPLPGFLSEVFLGRQLELYEEFVSADASDGVRISLNANGTWSHVRLLIIALASLLLSCRYFRTPRDLMIFLTAMTANGVLLSLFGVIQKLTTDGKVLYWSIPLTVGGTPFGPYVNRNNSAGFLLICLGCAIGLMVMVMAGKKNPGPAPIISKEIPFWRQMSQQLLYFISELTAVKLAAILCMMFIGLGIVASLSRGAVLGLCVGSVMTMISYGVARRPKNMGIILMPLALAVMLLAGWLGFSNDLIARIDKVDSTQELQNWNGRLQTWTDSWKSVGEMGRLGSGLGTYENISRLYRTDKETNRAYKYAENQYFQSLVEAGWFGFAVFLLAWWLVFYSSYFLLKIGQSPGTVSCGVVGVFVLWSQATASFFDFGFYIPANTLAMGCVMGVICYYAHSMAYRLKQKSFLRFHFPNTFVQGVLVVLFAFSTIVTLDLNRKSRIESIKSPRVLTQDSLAYEEVDARIKELSVLAANSQSYVAMNELGRLGIHRARLELFDLFEEQQTALFLGDTVEQKRRWDSTAIIQLQEESERLRRDSKLSQSRFKNLESIRLNLPFAKHWLEASLKQAPLQPEVQIALGEIVSLLDGIEPAAPYIERSVQIAPSNAILLKQAALLYIHAGEFPDSAKHLKRFLELDPKRFGVIMTVVIEKMKQVDGEVDHNLILEEMLPDNPELLYRYANAYAVPESLVQKIALEKAEVILDKVSQSDPTVNILKGHIRRAMGDNFTAIEFYESALVNNPNDEDVLLDLVNVLIDERRFDDAKIKAEELIRVNGRNRRYRSLMESIKSMMEDEN